MVLSDSDDDDDDILLTSGPTFRRPSRAQDVHKKHQMNLVDAALADSDRHVETLSRIAEMKRNEHIINDKELYAKVDALALAESVAKNYKRRSMEDRLAQDDNDDPDDALGKHRRVALAVAFDNDRSHCLGIRKTICFHLNRNHPQGNPLFYITYDDAINDLNDILRRLGTAIAADQRDDATLGFIRLLRPFMMNLTNRELGIFVKEQFPLMVYGHKDKMSSLHPDLFMWLYRVIQSAGLDKVQMSNLADSAIAGLLGSMQVLLQLVDEINLNTFNASLECWINFGLMCNGENSDVDTVKPYASDNLEGLSNLLHVWEHFFEYLGERSCDPSLATQCVLTLTRFAIDRFAISSKKSLPGSDILQSVLAKLLNYVARQWQDDKQERHSDWLKETAVAVLNNIETLGPGLPGAEDEDDVEAWLCYSALVRAFDSIPDFNARLCLRALEICFASNNFQGFVLGELEVVGLRDLKDLASNSLGWLALSSTLIGMVQIQKESADFLQTPTRFFATIDCLLVTFEAGMRLVLRKSDSMTSFSGAYETVEQARTASSLLGKLESECLKVSKKASCLAAQPHVRRADYAVKCYRYYFLTAKERADSLSGMNKENTGPKVQKRLESWILSAPSVIRTSVTSPSDSESSVDES